MADMKWTFLNAYTKVGEYLGLDLTDSDDVATAKDVVYRGYMKFLLPVSPKDEEIYIWSYLRQPWKLKFEDGKWEYPLPLNFERFYRRIEYEDRQNTTRMTKTSETIIMKSRNNLEFSSYPASYAIRTAKYNPKVGSTKEMIVYPTPSTNSLVNCTYVMTPEKPTEDTDFFIGGPLESECILQCCIAIAENQEDERIGVETQKAVELIQALIKKDKAVAPDTVGDVVDGNLAGVGLLEYRDYWINSGTWTVYGQEI